MKSIFKLDKSYDIIISMTWEMNHEHGVSGHIFEIIDYFFILKDKFKVGIFFGETILNWEDFEKIIKSKYNFSKKELEIYKKNTFYCNRPNVLMGKNILFVDGALKTRLLHNGTVISFKNIFSFKCSNHCNHTIFDIPYKVHLLSDKRVYSKYIPEERKIAIDYVKKILFTKLKKCKDVKTDTALLYLTSNCRYVSPKHVENIIEKYNFQKYILITNKPELYTDLSNNIQVLKPGVDNIFELFDCYIYTPVKDRFDCSPRFIAECKFFNKRVIYEGINRNYLKRDTGLKYRIQDVKNRFKYLSLNEKDEIFNIINERI